MNNYVIYDEIGKGDYTTVHKVNLTGAQEEVYRVC